MKYFLALIIIFIAVKSTLAQNQIQLYNVDGLPQSLLLNPGTDVSFDMHIGVPLFSGFHIQGGSTGVTFYDLFKKDNNSTFNDRIREQVFSLSRKDYFTVNENLEILSLGLRLPNGDYLSGGWYQETDAILYFPKDPAILAYEGNSDYIGKHFDVSDAVTKGEILSVFHLGYTRKVNESLTLGLRGKVYGSMFNFESIDNTGEFVTNLSPEGNNIYTHELINTNAVLQTSGTNGFDNLTPSQLLKNSLISGNMGVGLDFGFTYKFADNWQVTGSFVDLGLIAHTAKTKKYYLRGNYTLEGIEFAFPAAVGDDANPEYFDDLEDDFNKNVKYGDFSGDKYFTWRPLKVYGSIDYTFNGDQSCDCLKPNKRDSFTRAGLQFAAIKRPLSPQVAVTGFVDTSLSDIFRGKLTYTVDSYSFTNLGFLVSAQLNKFNLYLAADNVLEYVNLAKANNFSMQLGMQFVIHKRR